MTIEELLNGEGKNVEFKRELPKQSECTLSYDEMVYVGYEVTTAAVNKLCADIKKFMLAYADTVEAKRAVNDVTQINLENRCLLKRSPTSRIRWGFF